MPRATGEKTKGGVGWDILVRAHGTRVLFVCVSVDVVLGSSDRCAGFSLAQISLPVGMMPAAGGIVGVVLGGGAEGYLIESGRCRVFSGIEK